MYEAHLGLKDLPLRMVPDHRFYLDLSVHREAVEMLLRGLTRGDAFLMLTGDVGMGKTTVVQQLLAEIDRDHFAVGEMSSLGLEGDILLDRIASAFGLPAADHEDPPAMLQRFLEQQRLDGRAALLVIDEAQDLDIESLRRLVKLAAGSASGSHLLHTCLVGQHAPLACDELGRLGQPLPIGTACRLRALEAAEARAYILHRLGQGGWTGQPPFGVAATEAIHARCEGIPGRINLLCHRIVLELHAKKATEVSADVVAAVDNLLKVELAGHSVVAAPTLASLQPVPGRTRSAPAVPARLAPPVASGAPPSAPEPAWRAATESGSTNGAMAPGRMDRGFKIFSLADFSVLHRPPHGSTASDATADAAVAQGVAQTPQSTNAPPEPTPGDSPSAPPSLSAAALDGGQETSLSTPDQASSAVVPAREGQAAAQAETTALRKLQLSLAHASPQPGTPPRGFGGQRRLLPAAVVVLVLVGVGILWKSGQIWDDPIDARTATQGVVRVQAEAEGRAPGHPVREDATTAPAAAAAPSPTPRSAPGIAATSETLPVSIVAVSAPDSPLAPRSPTVARQADRQVRSVPAADTRSGRSVAVTVAGGGGVEAPPTMRGASKMARPTAAGSVPRSPAVASTAPAIPLSQQTPPDNTPAAVESPVQVAGCTSAAQTMGLCARPQRTEGVREAVAREAVARPCEPSRSALGLCADR